MLQISDLYFRYPRSTTNDLAVPAFLLARGEHAIVVGPSGSGKSTLLHLIAAIVTAQEGKLTVGDTEPGKLAPRAADTWRGRTIGFLPQKLALTPSLNTYENVSLAAYVGKQAVDKARIDHLLHALGLTDKATAKPHQLSQGQRQRVALARALLNRPQLLLADEPTANLDDASCAEAIALLLSQAEACGASMVIATHDARVLAALPQARLLRLTVHANRVAP